jgi:hypothetical protein
MKNKQKIQFKKELFQLVKKMKEPWEKKLKDVRYNLSFDL